MVEVSKAKLMMTQSLYKELADYKMNIGCGLQIRAKYVDGVEFPTSDSQLLGQWFEYQATGQLARGGVEPIAPRLKPKKLTQKEIASGLNQEDVVGELPKAYREIKVQIEAFKEMLEYYNIEIVETGKRIVDNNLNIQGDIDIVGRIKGEEKLIFIDVKSSGLLEDKWSDYGWADESIEYKDRLLVQSVHYKVLGKSEYGYYPDFYFWVFSTKNNMDRKVFKIEVDNDRFVQHLQYIRKAQEFFNENEANGWEARPNPKRCSSCPLASTCNSFSAIPLEKVVYY